jgi:acetyl esterase/lipase
MGAFHAPGITRRRPRSCLLAGLAALVTCAPPAAAIGAEVAPAPPAADGAGASTHPHVAVVYGVPFTARLPCAEHHRGCVDRADIYYPVPMPADAPTVVTVHGRPRSPSDMAEIAWSLARQGAVVFNIDYRGVRPAYTLGFPRAIEDIACGVRFAKSRTADFGGDPGRVVMVLHSMGGQVGSVAALAGGHFPGPRGACLADDGRLPHGRDAVPDGVVHVAGVSLTFCGEPLDIAYFGGECDDVPDRWRAGSVYTYTSRRAWVPFGIIYEVHDPVLRPHHALRLAAALRRGGHRVELIADRTGHTHFDILDTDSALGQRVLALTWRVIARSG